MSLTTSWQQICSAFVQNQPVIQVAAGASLLFQLDPASANLYWYLSLAQKWISLNPSISIEVMKIAVVTISHLHSHASSMRFYTINPVMCVSKRTERNLNHLLRCHYAQTCTGLFEFGKSGSAKIADRNYWCEQQVRFHDVHPVFMRLLTTWRSDAMRQPRCQASLALMVFVPYGRILRMKAKLIFRDKVTFPDGAILEVALWELPEKTSNQPHGFKYRLHYGLPGKTLVRYDNEKGKGDHRHIEAREELHNFRDVETLRADFIKDVESIRGERLD
jgi:hypothetical protein